MSKLVFDESNITIGDLEDFEDAIGLSLQDALKAEKVRDDEGNLVYHECSDECGDRCKDAGRPLEVLNLSAKAMKGLVWIVGRQSNPDFSLEDARRTRVTELEIVTGSDSDADPKGEPTE